MEYYMPDLKIELGLLGIIWMVCTFVAWGSFLAKQDIGVIGLIAWVVSLAGIAYFILYILGEM